MAVTAPQAAFDTPELFNVNIGTGIPISGTVVNVGDWLAYSGSAVFATNAGHSAFWKASGAGVAMESNPTYDWGGRPVQNTALRFVREGVLRVTGAFSGAPALGQGLYPVSTGSGVASQTGLSGIGSTWQTGIKLSVSGGTGVGGSGVGLLIGYRANGNGGTGELDVLIAPPRPDFY